MPSGVSKPATKRFVDVRVFPEFRDALKAAFVRKSANAALAVADPDGGRGVSVVAADDATLHDLNEQFRGFDEVTDVLSFGDESDASLTPEDADFPEFPSVPGEQPALGEIVFSYPLAVRQADEHNVRVEEEVALLIVHGVLHLLGYDHAEPDEEAAMKALEMKALAKIFPQGPKARGGAGTGGA